MNSTTVGNVNVPKEPTFPVMRTRTTAGIGVAPKFSEALHLSSFKPDPSADFEGKKLYLVSLSPIQNPMRLHM